MVSVCLKLSVSPLTLVRPVLVCGDHVCPRASASVQGVSHGAGGSVSLISNVRSIISNVTMMSQCLYDVMIRASLVATMCHLTLSSDQPMQAQRLWTSLPLSAVTLTMHHLNCTCSVFCSGKLKTKTSIVKPRPQTPKPQTQKPKTKGPWADTKISRATHPTNPSHPPSPLHPSPPPYYF